MSNSNSANMTMSERLAERLRTSELGAFLDSDDVNDLCRRAIDAAFFQERTVPDGSYSTRQLPPLVVEIATEMFRTHMADAVAPVVKALADSEAFRAALAKAALASIPDLIAAYGMRVLAPAFEGMRETAAQDAVDIVRGMDLGTVKGQFRHSMPGSPMNPHDPLKGMNR